MNLTNEFKDYAIKHMGISSMNFYQWEQPKSSKSFY